MLAFEQTRPKTGQRLRFGERTSIFWIFHISKHNYLINIVYNIVRVKNERKIAKISPGKKKSKISVRRVLCFSLLILKCKKPKNPTSNFLKQNFNLISFIQNLSDRNKVQPNIIFLLYFHERQQQILLHVRYGTTSSSNSNYFI